MSRVYAPGLFQPYRYRNPYYPAYYPYYPYYPQNNIIGSQFSNINQNLVNSGSMIGVNQIATSNNIRY